jgi:hypothetical protein
VFDDPHESKLEALDDRRLAMADAYNITQRHTTPGVLCCFLFGLLQKGLGQS